VGTNGIVSHSPLLEHVPSFFERAEPFLIQAFFSEAAIEAFDVPVLRGLTRINKMQLHIIYTGPLIQLLASELRSVFDLQQLGFAMLLRQLLHHAHHPLAA
jgi:hypothetical protein